VDAVYLIIHPEISAEAAASFQSSYEELDAYLENTLKPVSAKAGKPVLIGLSVSSTSDAHLGCSAAGVDCSGDHSAVGSFNNVDMDLQARITNALILSASTKPYINGFSPGDTRLLEACRTDRFLYMANQRMMFCGIGIIFWAENHNKSSGEFYDGAWNSQQVRPGSIWTQEFAKHLLELWSSSTG